VHYNEVDGMKMFIINHKIFSFYRYTGTITVEYFNNIGKEIDLGLINPFRYNEDSTSDMDFINYLIKNKIITEEEFIASEL
jgi:hypothetical protein